MPSQTSESTSTSKSEATRLATVYANYESPAVQSRWSLDNAGNRAVLAERTRAVAALLRRAGWNTLAGRRVLDVGCGSGRELARMTRFGACAADLHGVDLLSVRVAEARRTFPHLRFDTADAANLELVVPAESVDLVLAMTLFSSVADDALASRIAGQMQRVLKPGGAVLWYDMRVRNRANQHVRPYTRRDVAKLFPQLTCTVRSITLAPPLARRLGRMTRPAYPLLAALPPLRTHLLGWLQKPLNVG